MSHDSTFHLQPTLSPCSIRNNVADPIFSNESLISCERFCIPDILLHCLDFLRAKFLIISWLNTVFKMERLFSYLCLLFIGVCLSNRQSLVLHCCRSPKGQVKRPNRPEHVRAFEFLKLHYEEDVRAEVPIQKSDVYTDYQ